MGLRGAWGGTISWEGWAVAAGVDCWAARNGHAAATAPPTRKAATITSTAAVFMVEMRMVLITPCVSAATRQGTRPAAARPVASAVLTRIVDATSAGGGAADAVGCARAGP